MTSREQRGRSPAPRRVTPGCPRRWRPVGARNGSARSNSIGKRPCGIDHDGDVLKGSVERPRAIGFRRSRPPGRAADAPGPWRGGDAATLRHECRPRVAAPRAAVATRGNTTRASRRITHSVEGPRQAPRRIAHARARVERGRPAVRRGIIHWRGVSHDVPHPGVGLGDVRPRAVAIGSNAGRELPEHHAARPVARAHEQRDHQRDISSEGVHQNASPARADAPSHSPSIDAAGCPCEVPTTGSST